MNEGIWGRGDSQKNGVLITRGPCDFALCLPYPLSPVPHSDNPFLCHFWSLQGPYPTSPPETPGSLSLVPQSAPSPHTLGSLISKNQPLTQPGLCSFLLLTSPQVPGLLPQGEELLGSGQGGRAFLPVPRNPPAA